MLKKPSIIILIGTGAIVVVSALSYAVFVKLESVVPINPPVMNNDNNITKNGINDILDIKNATRTIESPDKKKIAYFISQINTVQSNITIYNKETKNKKKVAVPEWKYGHGDLGEYFRWSKKGNYIIFSDHKADEISFKVDIKSVNIETLEQKGLETYNGEYNKEKINPLIDKWADIIE